MSLKSLVNGVAIATIATAAVLAAPAAEAREWRRGGHSDSAGGPGPGGGRHDGGSVGHVNRWGDVRGGNSGDGRGAIAHGRGQHWQGGYENSRHGHGSGYGGGRDHTARNVAIGAFAAVLGLALAAESQRVREEYYDERD